MGGREGGVEGVEEGKGHKGERFKFDGFGHKEIDLKYLAKNSVQSFVSVGGRVWVSVAVPSIEKRRFRLTLKTRNISIWCSSNSFLSWKWRAKPRASNASGEQRLSPARIDQLLLLIIGMINIDVRRRFHGEVDDPRNRAVNWIRLASFVSTHGQVAAKRARFGQVLLQYRGSTFHWVTLKEISLFSNA